MKYLAAIPIVLIFVLLDIILILSIIGICIADDARSFPTSYKFAKSVFID